MYIVYLFRREGSARHLHHVNLSIEHFQGKHMIIKMITSIYHLCIQETKKDPQWGSFLVEFL